MILSTLLVREIVLWYIYIYIYIHICYHENIYVTVNQSTQQAKQGV